MKNLLLGLLLLVGFTMTAQSVTFSEQGRGFKVYLTSGGVSYASQSGDRISYDYNNNVTKVGPVRLSYDYNGRVTKIGYVRINWDYNGRATRVGGMRISYDYNGRITRTSGNVN